MEIKQFNGIPILEFGNDYVLTGMLYTAVSSGKSVILVLPQEKPDKDLVDIMYPTRPEWDKLLFQTDVNEVEAIRDDQRVILRKSQRNIDSKIQDKVLRRDNHACRYCGIDFVPMTVDHIVTWETNGATHEDNLVCSCRKCNKIRGNTPYKEWLLSDYYKNKMQYLTNDVIIKNQKLADDYESLPRVQVIRNR